MKCGLLGRKLGHSYSPAIHARLGEYEYALWEKEPDELADFLRYGTWDGMNVTIPFKQAVIPYLDELTPVASQLGAVNTIIRRNGKRIGHNTDYFGFQAMLQRSGLSPAGKKCLVLGSGGASKVAQAVLREHGAEVVVISRSGENHYGNLHLHSDAAILINTTPVGMYPDNGVSPVQLELFPRLEGVLDLIYNPARTQMILDAEKRSIVAENGLFMLVAQAAQAAEWFTGICVSEEQIVKIHNRLRSQMENIILIGMPGCGKSTVGKLLADRTGRQFVDTDTQVEELAHKSIRQIFAEDGEAAFRHWETKVLTKLGKQSGLVIATGGGCVTRGENFPLLHQNGTCFWLLRDLEKLPTEGRPLSRSGSLHQLFESRKALYQQFADHAIDNNHEVHTAVSRIMTHFNA